MIQFLRQLLFEDFWLKLLSLVLSVLIWLTVKMAIRTEVTPDIGLAGTAISEQTFHNIPVRVVFTAAEARNVRVNPPEVQVTVRAEPRTLQQLHARDIRAEVDLSGIAAARSLHKEIDITLPPGVTRIKTVPADVEVIVLSQR
jgi:YbbR domain-containing protein